MGNSPNRKPNTIVSASKNGISVALVLCFLTGSALRADTVQIDPAKDNTLYEDAGGTISNGSGSHLFAGVTLVGEIHRAVVAFDLSCDIPPGSTVNSVTLAMNMSRTIAGPFNVRLHVLLADWGEGASDASGQEGGGAASAPGDATWIHRFFNTDFWTLAGGDFSNIASASTVVSRVGSYTWGSTAQMVVDVQDWVDNPGDNFGWILLGDETVSTTSKRFDSRENGIAGNRPVLFVDFTPLAAACPNPCGVGASMDIKPGECPNSYNRGSQGVLPIALLGSDTFDVTQVDLSTVVLSRADGVGGSVGPNEGPPGPHSTFGDTGTPFGGSLCDCHGAEGDGFTDLNMKFNTDEVVAALQMNALSPGASVEFKLSGKLLDCTPFEAADCVLLVPPGTPPGLQSGNRPTVPNKLALQSEDGSPACGAVGLVVFPIALFGYATMLLARRRWRVISAEGPSAKR